MTSLVAFRAPYPRVIQHICAIRSPAYFYFVDTRDIGDWDFYVFFRRLKRGENFLLTLSERKQGKIKIGFGTDFYDAILAEIIREDADALVIPSEERTIIRERICKVRYI